jgi:hypothetical protein
LIFYEHFNRLNIKLKQKIINEGRRGSELELFSELGTGCRQNCLRGEKRKGLKAVVTSLEGEFACSDATFFMV